MHLAWKLAAVTVLLDSSLALAQTPWPAAMADYTRGWPETNTPAVLAAPAPIVTPDPGLDPRKKAFSGNWQGWACRSAACDVRVAVEQINDAGGTLSYAGANDFQGLVTDRAQAVFAGQELQAPLRTGARLALRHRADGDLDFSLARDGKLVSVGVLSQQAPAYRRSVERIATPWTHEGAPVTLEAVVYRPLGTRPWPTLVFNHGSTGNGDKPDLFKLTFAAPELGKYFVARGWQVVFPQRRGRGRSGGLYDEGFEPDRSRYSCRPELALAGMDRAVEDLDAVMAHLRAQPDVDAKRLLIGGVSRGGILSVAYAGLRPGQFQGVLNFVGGWVGDRCPAADQVNPVAFKRGAAAGKPMLWLYGDKDPFYSLKHSRANHKAFTDAGGQARFVAYDPAEGDIGHSLHPYPGLWRADVDAYLKALQLP